LTAIFVFFFNAGGPAIDPAPFTAFRGFWDVLTVAVSAAFVINAWLQWRGRRAGGTASPVKYLLMASSFGFWWFAMVAVDHPVLGLLLFEIFHDIQYNTLVWVYNRGRVAQSMTASRVESFLFRPGALRVSLYALLVLGYGYLGVVGNYSGVQAPDFLRATVGSVSAWTSLFTVSAFLHFYFDGFIWRVREREIRRGLGIGGGEAAVHPGDPPSGRPARLSGVFSSGWKWAFFVVPAVVLAGLELRGTALPMLGQFQSIVRIVPDSWAVNYVLGFLEKSGNDYEPAVEHYRRALELNPDLQPAHAELADIYFHGGRPDLALRHYTRAAELDPRDYKNRDHLATALLMQNRVGEALPHLLAAARHAPGDTNLAYLTGAALMHEGRSAEARPWLYRTLELDPGQPLAWNHLARAAQMRGDMNAAAGYSRRAAELDPQFARDH
jgi:Flp pilus assembly protein TadD